MNPESNNKRPSRCLSRLVRRCEIYNEINGTEYTPETYDAERTRVPRMIEWDQGWEACECRSETLVANYRRALADAIRRPMGIIPNSADGLVDMDDLRAAELRRPKEPTLEMCCSNGWANKF